LVDAEGELYRHPYCRLAGQLGVVDRYVEWDLGDELSRELEGIARRHVIGDVDVASQLVTTTIMHVVDERDAMTTFAVSDNDGMGSMRLLRRVRLTRQQEGGTRVPFEAYVVHELPTSMCPSFDKVLFVRRVESITVIPCVSSPLSRKRGKKGSPLPCGVSRVRRALMGRYGGKKKKHPIGTLLERCDDNLEIVRELTKTGPSVRRIVLDDMVGGGVTDDDNNNNSNGGRDDMVCTRLRYVARWRHWK
jgi:hypothetical protein